MAATLIDPFREGMCIPDLVLLGDPWWSFSAYLPSAALPEPGHAR